MSEQPINLVLASFSWFLDAKEDGVPPAHWLLVPNVPLEAAAYPDDMTFAAVLGPFYCTALWQGKAEQRGGLEGAQSSAHPCLHLHQQSSSRTRGGAAAKPHLPSYHKRSVDLQQRKAAQMGTIHNGNHVSNGNQCNTQ